MERLSKFKLAKWTDGKWWLITPYFSRISFDSWELAMAMFNTLKLGYTLRSKKHAQIPNNT